jgi:hypothetical protein
MLTIIDQWMDEWMIEKSDSKSKLMLMQNLHFRMSIIPIIVWISDNVSFFRFDVTLSIEVLYYNLSKWI